MERVSTKRIKKYETNKYILPICLLTISFVNVTKSTHVLSSLKVRLGVRTYYPPSNLFSRVIENVRRRNEKGQKERKAAGI